MLRRGMKGRSMWVFFAYTIDITDKMSVYYATIRNNIILAGIVFVLLELLFYVSWKLASRKLYRIIEEQTIEISEAKEYAEKASKAKSLFLANMSHEIRTPMNAITGFNQLMLGTELTDKQKDYVNKSQSAAYHLLGIINEILDFF